ncbi:hypothetical protein CTAYLR_003519 [Chrysophaeum taylorii]|uniref:Endonuclease/exonuclease/phosphatase domain-containing protein n=1 Tax=Chrysophaeum taylorii TaxID=2483200 RepID=A0AAD7UEI8_9STRA|nr:hypothetical protein CTAYLR_003519 [Chrysophaeum taylorii]
MMTQQLSTAFWCTNEVVRIRAQSLGAPARPGTSVSQLRVGTWNLLAPAYAKGLENTEWRARLARQQEVVDAQGLDVVALQEFWVAHAESVDAWATFAAERSMALFVLGRTRGKADGCATLVKSHLLGDEPFGLHYDDWGDRVCLVVPLVDVVVCNTHWTFAHDNDWDPVMRRHQARKLTSFANRDLKDKRVIVLGDLNGDVNDPAVSDFASSGWRLHLPRGEWVSHRAHTGAMLACDFIASNATILSEDCRVHGDPEDLFPASSPRVSDHNMVSATLHLR